MNEGGERSPVSYSDWTLHNMRVSVQSLPFVSEVKGEVINIL